MTSELIHWLFYRIFLCYLWQQTSLQSLHSTVNLLLQIYGVACDKYQFLLGLRKVNLPRGTEGQLWGLTLTWWNIASRSPKRQFFGFEIGEVHQLDYSVNLDQRIVLYSSFCPHILQHPHLSWFLRMENWMMWQMTCFVWCIYGFFLCHLSWITFLYICIYCFHVFFKVVRISKKPFMKGS